MNDLNKIIFITKKNPHKITKVTYGLDGAKFARSISGKPNTIAGKF